MRNARYCPQLSGGFNDFMRIACVHQAFPRTDRQEGILPLLLSIASAAKAFSWSTECHMFKNGQEPQRRI